jgi:hypothetical protein
MAAAIRIIRPSKKPVYLLASMTVAYLLVALGVVVLLPTEQLAGQLALIIALVVTLICIIGLTDNLTTTLRVTDTDLVRSYIIGRREMAFAYIESLRWRSSILPLASVKLIGSRGRIRIGLSDFDREDSLWLIRLLRNRVPDHAQEGWEEFCWRCAVPFRDGFEAVELQHKARYRRPRPPDEELVSFTRRRYDVSFAALMLIACIDSWCGWLWAATYLWFLLPATILALWMISRRSIPVDGDRHLPLLSPRNYQVLAVTMPPAVLGVSLPPLLAIANWLGWQESRSQQLAIVFAVMIGIAFAALAILHPLARRARSEAKVSRKDCYRQWRDQQISNACIRWARGEQQNTSPAI